METVTDFIFWGSKITADNDSSHEMSFNACSLEASIAPWKQSYDQLRQHIQKQGHHFADKVWLLIPDNSHFIIKWASLVAQMVKNLPTVKETEVLSLVWEDPLEKGMAAHSSILAWRIPWTEEPVLDYIRVWLLFGLQLTWNRGFWSYGWVSWKIKK